MKIFLSFVLISVFLLSCSQRANPVATNKGYLISKINNSIKEKEVGSRPLLYFNGEKISEEELKLLNQFEREDFISIQFLSKGEAIGKYGAEGERGAVLITPFIDDKLTIDFYQGIENRVVLDMIKEYAQNGLIKPNPVLVVNGVPLRGEEITSTINRLGESGISGINLLKKETAYQVYGIRAVNGVLMIDTK